MPSASVDVALGRVDRVPLVLVPRVVPNEAELLPASLPAAAGAVRRPTQHALVTDEGRASRRRPVQG